MILKKIKPLMWTVWYYSVMYYVLCIWTYAQKSRALQNIEIATKCSQLSLRGNHDLMAVLRTMEANYCLFEYV